MKRALAALIIVATVACPASTQKTAYDVLGIAAVGVDTAMKVYADQVVAGKVSQATQDAVKKDYGTYQIVMKDAQIAVKAWLALGTPPPPALFPTAQVGLALSAAAKVQAEVK